MENGGKEVSGFGNERVLVRRGNEMVCIFGEKRVKSKGERLKREA